MSTEALDKFAGRIGGALSGHFRLRYFTGDYWEANYFRGDTGFVWSPTVTDSFTGTVTSATTDKFSGSVTEDITDKFSGSLSSTIVTQVP